MDFNEFRISSSPYKHDTLVSNECSVLKTREDSDLCLPLFLILLQ